MDYAVFHRKLLGLEPEKTPAEFQVTPIQERLYSAMGKATPRNGFLLESTESLERHDLFVATFVIAYAQTSSGTVVFAVSKASLRWANEQIRQIARRIFHTRAKASRDVLRQLYLSFERLSIGSNILQLPEPDRWVAYGFHDQDLLPPWMRGRLLPVEAR